MIPCLALAAALATATPGSTIAVTGACPATVVVPARVWSPPITVDASAATVTNVTVAHVSGLTWTGGTFDGGGTVASGFAISNSDHVTVALGRFTNYRRNAIGLGPEANDSRITGNVISRSGSDGIDVALSRRVMVDHNVCMDFAPTPLAHPDCIQLWSRPTNAPTADITITDNIAVGDMQGFDGYNHVRPDATGKLVDDGGFDRIVVQRNFAMVNDPAAISLYSCRSCDISGNIVRQYPGAAHYSKITVVGNVGWTMGVNDTVAR